MRSLSLPHNPLGGRGRRGVGSSDGPTSPLFCSRWPPANPSLPPRLAACPFVFLQGFNHCQGPLFKHTKYNPHSEEIACCWCQPQACHTPCPAPGPASGPLPLPPPITDSLGLACPSTMFPDPFGPCCKLERVPLSPLAVWWQKFAKEQG